MDINVIEHYHSLMNVLLNATIYREDHNISIVADWFHKIPHLDIKLQYLKNTTFDPNDNEYLESLGILVALPGFWLILTLLFFLIFFLCRCCDANTKKKKKLTCCKLCLFLFALISCSTIAVGMFGHWLSHNGVVKVEKSTRDLANVVDKLKMNGEDAVSTFENTYDDVRELITILGNSPLVRNGTVRRNIVEHLNSAQYEISRCKKKISEISSKVEKLDPEIIPSNVHKFEQIRWPATFGLLGTLAFICLILICGICRHSRCLLILFSVLGLLSLVLCWVITSLYLGICVAGSDFCLDPEPFIYKQMSGLVDTQVANYYIECDSDNSNPFRKGWKEASKALENIRKSVTEVEHICKINCDIADVRHNIKNLNQNLTMANELVRSIGDLTNCDRINQDYIDILSATCKDVLEGISLMLVSAAACGLCFTLLVLCASHTWINIRKKRPTSESNDQETDPFLPPPSASSTASSGNSKRYRDPYGTGSSGRPRFSHTPPQTPHFPPPTSTPPSAPNGRSLTRDGDHLSFLSPPPAYEQVGPVLHHNQQHQHQHHQQQHHHHQQHQHSHQSIGPHYVADSDLMMRATQATKF